MCWSRFARRWRPELPQQPSLYFSAAFNERSRVNKKLSPANRALSAISEGLFFGWIGSELLRNDWRFLGVCVILAAVALAVWIMLPSSDD
ncbi:hypothetical protein D3C87_1883430 [compost metagenome]